MRLAIDATNLAHDRRGMGRVVRPIVRAACADPRFEVTLLAKPAAYDALRADFGSSVSIDQPARAGKRGRFDAVWLPFNGMRFACAAPALVTIYDVFAFTEPAAGVVARWREQTPIRRAAKRARRIVTISQWSAQSIVDILGVDEQRIRIILPAPDPFFFPAPGDALPSEVQGTSFVLLIGGREGRKNNALAIEAATLALRAPEERLAVVGALNDADEARLQSCGVPLVRLHADDEMLRALYRNASLVLVPSRGEGFGLVAAEAIACGAPVIAANAAALPEATGDAAVLLDPDDTALWATAIRRLLDDERERDTLRARATARWSLDRDGPVRAMLDELRDTAGP
ncbi:MAG TPA: glycosyltransferase family 1 protein [Candidatus Baltobacteraceae bacterium]